VHAKPSSCAQSRGCGFPRLPLRQSDSTLRPTTTRNHNNKKRKVPITSHSHEETRTCAATLLARIEAHPLSAPGDPLAFECRLADDNGWTLGHAVRVVREYRRFLVLTQVAGTPVCPSDDVDQAWHLHLTRTADYERFCREVLGRFLHHRPAEPGSDEHQRHRGMYVGTLSLYRRTFQSPAPRDVWPEVDERFSPPAPAPAMLRLPAALQPGWMLAIAGLLAALALAMLLNRLGVLDASHDVSGPGFLHFAVPATMLLVVLGCLSTAPFQRGSPRDTLDLYEAAWLSGGKGRVVATAIGLLVDRGRLALRTTAEGVGRRRHAVTRLVVVQEAPQGALHPVEGACLQAARDGILRFQRADIALRSWSMRIGARLRRAGLAGDDATIAPARAAVAIVTGAWLAVELERIGHAIGTFRPMGFLVFLTLATAVSFVLLTLRGGGTWRGERALRGLGESLRAERTPAEERASRSGRAPRIAPRLLPMTLALLGPAAVLAQPGFGGLDDAIGSEGMRLARARHGSGGGDGGGGCGGGSGCGGGGGCGGGCGGCGG